MINWLRKKLGIDDLEMVVAYQHQDIEAITRRLEAITLAVGRKRVAHFLKRAEIKQPQRYDEIERARKIRKKGA